MNENLDPLSSEMVESKTDNEFCTDRKLALEICLTSICFKNMDFVLETESDMLSWGIGEDENKFVNPGIDTPKNTGTVIEQESLWYIGGYVVNKFHLKYPHLGMKANSNGAV